MPSLRFINVVQLLGRDGGLCILSYGPRPSVAGVRAWTLSSCSYPVSCNKDAPIIHVFLLVCCKSLFTSESSDAFHSIGELNVTCTKVGIALSLAFFRNSNTIQQGCASVVFDDMIQWYIGRRQSRCTAIIAIYRRENIGCCGAAARPAACHPPAGTAGAPGERVPPAQKPMDSFFVLRASFYTDFVDILCPFQPTYSVTYWVVANVPPVRLTAELAGSGSMGMCVWRAF